jgi:3-oxoacyl-[acyl-carrier-protein] synthase-3
MATKAAIRGIRYYLPEDVLTNDELSAAFPEWGVDRILAKTGVAVRHIAAPTECASDLAVRAAEALFADGVCGPEDVDFLLLCTQSPDYFLPTTACLLQDRLGLRTDTGALDFNLGCSGFVYGLALAKGLIEGGMAGSVLLITSETYTKYIHPADRSVRTIFGDGAAATLIGGSAADGDLIGPIVFGTNGSGGEQLIVESGAMRERACQSHRPEQPGSARPPAANLYMNGPAIFQFALDEVPSCVEAVLAQADLALEDIDYFVFHQANRFMLEHLRRKLEIPAGKFCINMETCGNTVSASIPIALQMAQAGGQVAPGQRVLLVGFGVGYSWAGAIVTL